MEEEDPFPGASDNNNNNNNNKLVNSREWSVDEQLLWKSHRFRSPSVHNNSNNNNNANATTTTNSKPTFTTRNGEVLTLKEHDVVFEPPLLEDPSRDFLAAYYYHVGVQPKDHRKPETPQDPPNTTNNNSTNNNSSNKQLMGLVQKHSSPYHMNQNIRRDGLAALLDASEEKQQEELEVVVGEMATTSLNAPKIGEVAWMPDRLCKTCYSCDTPFTVFRRRHHCRLCGQVFCNKCSGYFVPAAAAASCRKLSIPENTNNNNSTSAITLRSCKMCFDIVTEAQEKQATSVERKRKQQGNNNSNAAGTITNSITTELPAATPKRGPTFSVVDTKSSSNNHNTATTNAKPQQQQGGSHSAMEESSAFLRQWSKAIGAEGITSLATKTAGMVMDETHEAVAAAAAAVLPLSSVKQQQQQQQQSKHSATTSSSTIPAISAASSSTSASSQKLQDRSSLVKEGNRHLGETAASHLEQMTASLLESDAPLLWKHASKKEDLQNKWVHKLMSLATRCCATVDTNVKKGDMLDIRPYVKIKGKR